MRNTTTIGFLAVMLALAGCDNGGGNTDTDSGMTDVDGGVTGDPDSGTNTGDPDGGTNTGDDDGGTNTGDACESARTIALEMGEQTITGNTTGMSSDLVLSDGCGGLPTPQELLALTVPGTGEKFVSFDLAVEGTEFDTTVELRTAACDSSTDAVCFDDVVYPDEVRSAGHFVAEGGSTVYLIVTGYTFPDEPASAGPWTMAVEVLDTALPAPTLTGGDVLRVDSGRLDILINGGDADGDAIGIRFSLLNAAGTPIEVDFGDGFRESEFEVPFGTDMEGQTTFTDAMVEIYDSDVFDASAEATHVQVAVYDRFRQLSAAEMIPIRDVSEVGRGEACDENAVCSPDLECNGGTCGTPANTLAACDAATAVTVTEGAPGTASGNLEPGGSSHLWATCDTFGFGTGGPEDLYTVTLPAGAFDLIASTENATTGEADTFVYIQTECGNETTEVACNDDFGEGRSSRAVVENAAGTYTIAVEIWGGPEASTPYQLDVNLRPVLGAGEACDPAEIANRCSTGACPAGDSPVCPDAPAP